MEDTSENEGRAYVMMPRGSTQIGLQEEVQWSFGRQLNKRRCHDM
jgi:hypothetical protein